MGFASKWTSWIMFCVKFVSYSLVINGKRMSSIIPKRGIRQRDPLSPYIFILIAKVLSSVMQKAINEGQLQGVKLGKIFNDYFCATGQLVNFDKSIMFFSPNTAPRVREELCSILRIS